MDNNPPSDIDLLQRKIEREKKARKIAEQQLEIYSREIYQTNQSLKKSLDYAQKKNAEIEYITKASTDVSSELTLSDILQNTVSLTASFLNADYGINATFEANSLLKDSNPLIWSSNAQWNKDDELQSFFIKKFMMENYPSSPRWSISQVNNHETINGQKFRWLACINFKLEKNTSAWIGFLTKEVEPFDKEALHMLEIAKSHLRSGIRRRIADASVKKRNKQLEDIRKQLIHSEKMSSLGQLSAGVAHEINNPIGYIRANLQALSEYLQEYKSTIRIMEDKVNARGSLSKAEFNSTLKQKDMKFLLEDAELILESNLEGVERVKEIVEELKSFSHAGDDNLSEISVYDCVDTALRIVANQFKYQHQIINELEDSLPNVMSNYGQLQQVFINLLINSAHAMPTGGVVRISSESDDQYLFIRLKDTGTGMDEKTKTQIFNPFFTTKPVGQGTGLGLSVSYAILEAQNISINVDSELDKGTCFTLAFPLY